MRHTSKPFNRPGITITHNVPASPAPVDGLVRWNIEPQFGSPPTKHAKGEWIRHSDAAATITRLEEELAETRKLLKRYHDELGEARALLNKP